MTSDMIEVIESLRIERPPAVVHAQYLDIDHHIRDNVHPGIVFSWVPSERGTRKLKTEFRLVGVKQFDVCYFIDKEGVIILDFVEGVNAGMKVWHEFLPAGDSATTVRITGHLPSTFGRRILGRLFKYGAAQTLRKTLREDKADLEGGQFSPGRLRGNTDAALGLLKPFAERERSLNGSARDAVSRVLDVAALVAAADGEVDGAERDALARIARSLDVIPVDDAGAQALLDRWAAVATGGEAEARARALGARWKELGIGAEGLIAPAIVAQASFGVAVTELAILRVVAEAAGLPETTIESSLRAADEALSAPIGNGAAKVAQI
jgi:hypothetical protein